MPRVYLGLGSNIEREKNLRGAVQALQAQFGDILVSPVYESAAVGFEGDPFYNLVVGIDTEKSVGELAAQLRAIEEAWGRDRCAPKFSSRTLDIDILTWGNACGRVDGVKLPRDEILKNAFVLKPLADLAGHDRHPETARTYAEHWDAFDHQKQPLSEVALPFDASTLDDSNSGES